jgi:hypothetical protein
MEQNARTEFETRLDEERATDIHFWVPVAVLIG